MYFLIYMVMSYDASPTIDAWLCHVIHHLPSMHSHVIWHITYHLCLVISYDTSPSIDAWLCNMIYGTVIAKHRCMVMFNETSPTFDAWSCHMMHHLPSMSYVLFIQSMHGDTSPTIDAWSCHIIHHLSLMPGHIIWYITYHRCMVMFYDTSSTIVDSSPTNDI